MKKLIGYALVAMMVVSFGIGCSGSTTTKPAEKPAEKKEADKEKKEK